MPAHMRLCPQCKSIQKADTRCSICGYPVPPMENPDEVKSASALSRALYALSLQPVWYDVYTVFYSPTAAVNKEKVLECVQEVNRHLSEYTLQPANEEGDYYRLARTLSKHLATTVMENLYPLLHKAVAGSGLKFRIERRAQQEDTPFVDGESEVDEVSDDTPVTPGTPRKIKNRISSRMRSKVNEALMAAGMDGNRMFEKPSAGLSATAEVLYQYGIEIDDIPDSYSLTQNPRGRLTLYLAFRGEDGLTTTPVENSMLVFHWYEHREYRFECLAYLS